MAARSRGGLLSPMAYLRTAGLAKGVYGGNPAWRNVFLVITVWRFVQRSASPAPQVLARDKLKPGQSIEITAIDPKIVRQANKQAAAAAKAADAALKADKKAAKHAKKQAKRDKRQAKRQGS